MPRSLDQLRAELVDAIAQTVAGTMSVCMLEDHLAHTAQDAVAAGPAYRRLHNQAWLAIGEFDQDMISDIELADRLRALKTTATG
jgi:hypothetical protein